MPPNNTFVLQPLDQGIFYALKCKYRKRLTINLLDKHNNDQLEENITVKEALNFIRESWREIINT